MSEADEYGHGGDRESGPQSEDAIRDETDAIECPECGQDWIPSREPRCPGCLLSWEDVEAGADFYDHLTTNGGNQ